MSATRTSATFGRGVRTRTLPVLCDTCALEDAFWHRLDSAGSRRIRTTFQQRAALRRLQELRVKRMLLDSKIAEFESAITEAEKGGLAA